MTKEAFRALPRSEQAKFLAEGGSIESEQKSVNDSGLFVISPESTRESPSTPLASVPLLGGDVIQPEPYIAPQPATIPQSSPEIIQMKVGAPTQFDGFIITDPVELLFLLDDEISSGRVTLHGWQIKILTDFALDIHNDITPYQAVVRACNGSGKDKYVLAPCIVWLCMRYKFSIGVVTSSSGVQLDNQTCRYIKFLSESANRRYMQLFGFEPWQCKYRHYACLFPNELGKLDEGPKSEIFCYATDEAGKAEGYHPTVFGAKMAILVSEDKTVQDDINVALNKCTGYTHRLHVSTPGLPMGHFFDYCSLALSRDAIKTWQELKPTDWIQYHVTAMDCSHLSTNYIEQMKRDLPGGELGSAYKSQVLAEFGTTDEMVVIPYTYIWRAVNNPPAYVPEAFNTGGLDLADGGAETVLAIRNGNKLLKIIPFKFDADEMMMQFLSEKFKEWGLDNPESLIYGDCTGIGSPILKVMRNRGWKNIKFIDSRAKSRRPKVYLNCATELFFNLRNLLEKHVICLCKDDVTVRQLSTRYYKINTSNVHQLLSKIEQRSRGYPSPDRADAVNLCFWNYQSTIPEEAYKAPFELPEDKTIQGDFTLKAWANGTQKKWKANEGISKNNFSSLEEEVEQYNNRLKIKQNV